MASVRTSADAGNAKKISVEAHYAGTHTVTSVAWSFGDGATLETSTLTTQHTYAAAGNYTVKAVVTLKLNDMTCSVSPTKAIVVN